MTLAIDLRLFSDFLIAMLSISNTSLVGEPLLIEFYLRILLTPIE